MVQTKRSYGFLALVASVLLYSLPLAVSAATCVVGTNCIPNAGFETGFTVGPVTANTTANNWSVNAAGTNNAAFSIVADAHTPSTKAAKVAMTTYTDGYAQWAPETATVSPGQFYTISFWYKSSTTTSAFVVYNNGAPQWFKDLPVSPTYTQVSAQFLIPQGTTQLQVFAELSRVGEIIVDDYDLQLQALPPVFPHGLVTLSFDDGWTTFDTVAKPILNANNVKATAYIITGLEGSNIGSTPNGGYMNTATIQALQQSGFEIGAHTRNHVDLVKDDPVAFGYADRAAMWASEITASRTDLTGAGFAPVSSIAYPYGSYDNAVKAAVQAAGFSAARTVDQGFNYTNSDKYALKIMPINDQSTVAGVTQLIDQAMADKTWLILMFHHVRTGTESTGAANAACVDDANPSIRDTDCTTSAVLQGISSYLATIQQTTPGVAVTMQQGLAAMDAATNSTITASSDTNGTITPSGSVSVVNGSSPSFTLTPNIGFHLGTLLVDGLAAATTSLNTYTFTNVTTNHTIAATFVPDVDTIAPTVTLSSVITQAPGQTNAASIPVTVAFSEAVSGFEMSDIVVSGASITGFATTSNSATFNVEPTADGSIQVSVAAGAVQDLAVTPNASTASNVLSFESNRTAPIITRTGSAYVSTPAGSPYVDLGATIVGTTTLPVTTSTVNTSVVGTYTVTYSFTDYAGNVATPVTRTVVVTELGTIADQTSSSVTTSSVTINWTTAASGTSRVVYDTVSHDPLTSTSTNYGYANSTTEDATMVTTHSVTVSGLSAGTTYYFRAISHGSPEVLSPEITVKTVSNPAPAVSGGGGGGGGNGPIAGSFGGGSLIPAFTTNPGAAAGNGIVLGASTFKFLNNLSRGMRHGDVIELQKRLVTEGFLTIDAPTNYFGSMTVAAVKKYQAAHGIEQLGNVGPKTRAALNAGGATVATADAAKLALIDTLKAKLAELMKKIAELMAAGAGTATTATTTATVVSTSTTSVATSTDMTIGTSTAPVATSTAATSTQM